MDQISQEIIDLSEPNKIDNKEAIRRFYFRQHFFNLHPYTCCSQTDSGEPCDRDTYKDNTMLAVEKEDGTLAIQCPCGKAVQKWLHGFDNLNNDSFYEDYFNNNLGFRAINKEIKWFLMEYNGKTEEEANSLVELYNEMIGEPKENKTWADVFHDNTNTKEIADRLANPMKIQTESINDISGMPWTGLNENV